MNDFLKLIQDQDNAKLAEDANESLGLGVVPTSIPLEQGLTNDALAAEQAQQSVVDRAPAIVPQNPQRGPALGSNREPASISPEGEQAPSAPESAEARLERLMNELKTNRSKEIDEARSSQLKRDIFSAISSNMGNIVGGAQAMNTGASVTPVKTAGLPERDLMAIVEKKYKPEYEALMDQYKSVKKANEPMTPYQSAMLNHMSNQLELSKKRADDTMERYGGTQDRLWDKQKFDKEQKDEYSDKQTESLTGFDKTSNLLDQIEGKINTGKFDKYLGPYDSKIENAKEYNPLSSGMDEDFAMFQADVTDSLSQYIKGLSGLTVSDKERSSLLQSMPKVGDKPQTFRAKLKATKERLALYKKTEMAALNKYQGKGGKTAGKGTTGSFGGEQAPSASGPYGDTVERNGKTYKWNPAAGKYQLL